MGTAYDEIGQGYRKVRRSDPRIAARIEAAIGDARTIVNVGAGAGSYEPPARELTAVEPSAELIAQRPVLGRASSIGQAPPTAAIERGLQRLREDLRSGVWDERYGQLRGMSELDVGLRLVVSELYPTAREVAA